MWLDNVPRELRQRSFAPYTPTILEPPDTLLTALRDYPEPTTAAVRSMLAAQWLSNFAVRMVQELGRGRVVVEPIRYLRNISVEWSDRGSVSNTEVIDDLLRTAGLYGEGQAEPHALHAALRSAAALVTAAWDRDDRGIRIQPEAADMATMVAEFMVVYAVHREHCGLEASDRLLDDLVTDLVAP